MSYPPKEEFINIAKEIITTGKPQKLTVRELLAYFYREKRTQGVTARIRKAIADLGLDCEPNFEGVYIDAEIELRKRPSQNQDSSSESRPEKDPVPRIGLLPAANKPPTTINRDSTIKQAITLMLMHDFSQLPVTQNSPENLREIDGFVSLKSIVNAQTVNGNVKWVRECIDRKVTIVSYDDSLFEVVDTVMEQGVVLVKNQQKKIQGLVTITDIGKQFVALAKPFLILEQIENHIRNWLEGCFTVEQLQSMVDPADTKRDIASISDLTFGEYIRILQNPAHWQALNLHLDCSIFTKQLDEVRQIRNDVMHFHPDGISAADLEKLSETSRFFSNISQFRK